MRAPPGVKDDESERQITKGSRGKASLLTLVRECLRIQCGSSLPDFLNN